MKGIVITIGIVAAIGALLFYFSTGDSPTEPQSQVANPSLAKTKFDKGPLHTSEEPKSEPKAPPAKALAQDIVTIPASGPMSSAAGSVTFIPMSGDRATAERGLRQVNGKAIDTRFSTLYKNLGLSPEQQELMRDLKLDSIDRSSELFKRTVANLPKEDAEIGAQVVADETRAIFESAVREKFGNDVADKVRHYENTFPARQFVLSLDSSLHSSGIQLSPEQSERLVGLVAVNATGQNGRVNLRELNTPNLIQQASSILSPEQLDVLKRARK